jgi:hypothetical protein
MAAGDELLIDPVLGRAERIYGVEDLLLGGDVIRVAGQQISRACSTIDLNQKPPWPRRDRAPNTLPWLLFRHRRAISV